MLESSDATKAVASVDGTASTPKPSRKLHPVFGSSSRIKGFALSRQMMAMLDFWHHKACKLIRATELESQERVRFVGIRQRIFEAAIRAKPPTGQQLACLLNLMAREFAENGVGVGGSIGIADFRRIARHAEFATKPDWPEKPVGPLTRGSKLTRAGLLVRYQSYLVQELETVSWSLYGSRDFAKHYRMEDTEVSRRCRPRGRNWRDPFFQAADLPRRARAVLRSLRINVVDEDEHQARRRSAVKAAKARKAVQ